MKKIINKCVLSLFFLLSIGLGSYSYGLDELSYTEEKVLLELIRIRCLDTWCEGSKGFYFHTFDCSFDYGECTFGFEYWDRHDESGDSEEHTCVISAKSERSLFRNRSQFRITEKLYNAINKCMEGLDY